MIKSPCQSAKIKFEDRAGAERWMRQMLQAPDNIKARDRPRLNVYRCTMCNGWHVGRSSK